MAIFESQHKFAKLKKNYRGYIHSEDDELVDSHLYQGKKGKVIRVDVGYDVEYPTGEEPFLYLLEFEDNKQFWFEAESIDFF